ncbi:Protein FAR1-RELATED SEQUENCE 5 [Linum perenne]
MVYGRHMFIADMMSTQRSESMNNVLKKYLKPKHNMLYFFEHYIRLVEDRRYKELLAEFKMRDTSPMLKVNVEMLRDASVIYTPQVFQMFQEEYIKALDCSMDKTNKTEDQTEYKVKYSSKVTEHQGVRRINLVVLNMLKTLLNCKYKTIKCDAMAHSHPNDQQ